MMINHVRVLLNAGNERQETKTKADKRQTRRKQPRQKARQEKRRKRPRQARRNTDGDGGYMRPEPRFGQLPPLPKQGLGRTTELHIQRLYLLGSSPCSRYSTNLWRRYGKQITTRGRIWSRAVRSEIPAGVRSKTPSVSDSLLNSRTNWATMTRTARKRRHASSAGRRCEGRRR